MRISAVLCSLVMLHPEIGRPQFKSTARLVVAPTTIADAKGRFVDGLEPQDLVLYDDNVPQTIQMDWMAFPIDLVVAVQTGATAGAVIDKLGGSGVLFTQLLAAQAGETAIVSFSDRVITHQAFTGNADSVTHTLRMLRKEGGDAHVLDALVYAMQMLEARQAGRRRIVLMIAEKRDRGSSATLPDAMERVQRQNASVYWLNYSPFLQPFTVKPKRMEDLKPEAERIKEKKCALCPEPDDRPAPLDVGPGGALYAIGELARLRQPDLSELFTMATGGRNLNFLKKNALEQAIQLVSEEIHRQYVLSFEPKAGEPGRYHSIRVVVKGRPDLRVTVRQGYWGY
jgi:VWFA-related protein